MPGEGKKCEIFLEFFQSSPKVSQKKIWDPLHNIRRPKQNFYKKNVHFGRPKCPIWPDFDTFWAYRGKKMVSEMPRRGKKFEIFCDFFKHVLNALQILLGVCRNRGSHQNRKFPKKSPFRFWSVGQCDVLGGKLTRSDLYTILPYKTRAKYTLTSICL